MAILSVILPLYNGSRCVERCINSILNQTHTDFEIICVDDGSVDDTYAKCEVMSSRDNRVKMFKKSNAGVASAREYGLRFASGKYITFIDQDDWIEHDMYQDLLNAMHSSNADLGVCGFYKNYDDHTDKMKNIGLISKSSTDINDIIKYAFYREKYRNYAAYVWNKIFSANIIKEHNLQFDVSLRRGDDVLFFVQYALNTTKATYINRNYYHYLIHNQSTSNNKTKNNLSVLEDILKGYEKAIELLENDMRIMSETIDYLKCFYVYHASILYEIANEYHIEDKLSFFRSRINMYYSAYYSQNKADISRIEHIRSIMEETNG